MSRREREVGGASRLSIETLLSHSTEKLRRGNLCFRRFLVSKNVKDKRERGASRLSLENLLSHRTEQLRRGNLCFRKFLVSKNVKHMSGISRFSVENFMSHCTEKFCRGTFQCFTNFGYRKMLGIREAAGITIF